jgi:hypothetical protein
LYVLHSPSVITGGSMAQVGTSAALHVTAVCRCPTGCTIACIVVTEQCAAEASRGATAQHKFRILDNVQIRGRAILVACELRVFEADVTPACAGNALSLNLLHATLITTTYAHNLSTLVLEAVACVLANVHGCLP